MTQVNITTNKNVVTVNETDNSVITVATQGPQGTPGIDISDTNRVDKSILYYDNSAGTYKADATWTTSTLVDGGNF